MGKPKFILAFDSFKGCLSAEEACISAAEGIRCAHPDAEIISIPLSDGGEGLVSCISKMLDVEQVTISAHGPLMEPIEATYAISKVGKTAYMEMASTSGLTLVPENRRNPLLTTTYGVGDMIFDAYQRGVEQIIMGIGGSATCDGGQGMIESLTSHLSSLNSNLSALSSKLKALNSNLPSLTIACDVTNPLYGENGAAYIFAPQKGATPKQVKILDERLREFAKQTEALGIATPDTSLLPGTGAAGGLGYGLVAYLGATLRSGIDIILDIVSFDNIIKGADAIFTGEGKSDHQTLMGKVPQGVLHRAQKQGIPVHLVSGAIEDQESLLQGGFTSVSSINQGDHRPLHILLQPEVAKANLRKHLSTLTAKL